MNLIRLALAAAILAVPIFSQSRNVEGHYLGSHGPTALSCANEPQSVEMLAPSLPFAVPRWDGRDDAGNVLPWSYLRGVQLAVRCRLDVLAAGENTTPSPVGLWQVETGVRSYFGRSPSAALEPAPSAAWGGGSFAALAVASEGLPPFDGSLDGAGASGWTQAATGTPTPWEYLDLGANREDLRAWCGTGSVVVHWMPRQHTVQHGMPSHWRAWDTSTVEVLDIAPGAQVLVRYVLGAPPFAGAYSVERSAWADYGLMRAGDRPLMSIAAPLGDPAKLLGVFVEYAEENGRWIGIENLAAFTATCGGSSHGGVRIERDQMPVLGLWSNSSAGAGSFAPVSAFDGTIDWHGVSGRETWQAAYFTSVWRAQAFGATWCGPVQLEACVTQAIIAPESLTPGATFAWEGAWRFSGRSRLVWVFAL